MNRKGEKGEEVRRKQGNIQVFHSFFAFFAFAVEFLYFVGQV
jgi:hypothetical protein